MFKMFLNLFGKVFGLFEEKWKFFHFSDLFPSFDPPACTGRNFFPKKYLKTSSTLVWKLLKRFWTLLGIQFFSIFFSNFYKFWSPGCTGQEKFGKNHLKRNLDTFGNVFRDFEKLNFFHFLKFFDFSTLQGALGEFFYRKKYLEACWKQVWTLLGTYLGILKIESFPVFWSFSTSPPSRLHWAKFLTGKNTSKLVPNMFDCFWERFLGILKNWKFFQFFGIFPSFDAPGCTGQFFPKKITSQQFQNLFGHF